MKKYVLALMFMLYAITGNAATKTLAGDDCSVRKAGADKNFDSYGLWCGAYEAESLIRFGVVSIPAGSKINSVELRLYCNRNDGLGLYITELNESWSESSVTWNTRPVIIGNINFNVPSEGTGWWHISDNNLVRLVQGWVDGTRQNYGLILDANPQQTGKYLQFSDGEQSTYYRPKLIINYTSPNQAPNTPYSEDPDDDATSVSRTSNLDWRCSDPDGDTVYYTVYFEKNDSSPNDIIKNDSTGSSASLGTLDYDSHYYWKVVADDHNGGVTTGPVWDFWTEKAPTRVISLWGDLDCGNVSVDSSATRTLTISNPGNSTLNVSGISYPSGFSGDWSGSISGGGGHQDVTVTFAPTAATSYGGTITVNSDKTSGTNTRSCSGVGTVSSTRVMSLSGDLSFGNVTVASSATRTLTISNTGNSTLNVSGISYPSRFSSNWSGSIPAGSSRSVTVTFAPTAATSYGGTITVSSDKTGGTNTRSCSGTGASVSTYTLTVDGGSGGNSYAAGASVSITAQVPTGKVFDRWTVSPSQYSYLLGSSETASFTMPAANLSIVAVFVPKGGGTGTTYPLNGFSGKWVAPYLWDYSAQEYSMICEPEFEPEGIEIGDLVSGQWYWLCIMESSNKVNWSFADGSWISHLDEM